MLREGWDIEAREVLHQLMVFSKDSEKRIVSDEGSHHCDLAITVFMAADFMAGKHFSSRVESRVSPVGVTHDQVKRFFKRAS